MVNSSLLLGDDPNLYLRMPRCKECGGVVLPPEAHTCAQCWKELKAASYECVSCGLPLHPGEPFMTHVYPEAMDGGHMVTEYICMVCYHDK